MSGIESNLKLNTQIAPAASPQRPTPSEPVSAPTKSIQDVSRDVQASKGESAKQLSQNMEDVKAAVKTLNIAMKKVPTSLQFSVDSASHRFVVNVTNKDTGELVRSMPGEAILRIAQNLESLKGVLFDELY
ncbi:flagellar protein FlaG [Gammaproteobacteria bacterium MOLA455]|nr:flagellar protein FlaG [Gammaproteobacteria bacterium MOLA455]